MITLHEAIARIVSSCATNEGTDALLCDGVNDPVRADTLRDRTTPGGSADCVLSRRMRNWEIIRNGTVLYRSWPWDDSPNVAFLASPGRGDVIRAAHEFVGRLDALTAVGERAGLYQPVLTLCHLSLRMREAIGMPTENLRREIERVERICAELRR